LNFHSDAPKEVLAANLRKKALPAGVKKKKGNIQIDAAHLFALVQAILWLVDY